MPKGQKKPVTPEVQAIMADARLTGKIITLIQGLSPNGLRTVNDFVRSKLQPPIETVGGPIATINTPAS